MSRGTLWDAKSLCRDRSKGKAGRLEVSELQRLEGKAVACCKVDLYALCPPPGG
jgi:hypothetical protein